MSKKLMIVMVVLCLSAICLCGAMAEEETYQYYADIHPGVKEFDSLWVSDDGNTRMEAYSTMDRFEILIVRMTGEHEFVSWEYLPEYDDASKTLAAEIGMKSVNVSDENNIIIESEYEYDDGHAVFSIDGNGKLLWKDEVEDAGAGMAFNKIGWFAGDYSSDDALIKIRWNMHENDYDVDIDWHMSENQMKSYIMHGGINADTGALDVQGFSMVLNYKEDGEIDLNADFEEQEVSSSFAFDDNSFLTWTSSDGMGDGIEFENDFLPLFAWYE